jgi:hypothetical protein
MDIESFTKNVTQYMSNGPFNDLFTNPIYVAMLITVIVMLIVVCMFNEKTLIKTSFYVLFTCVFVIFIHNKLLLIVHQKQLCNADSVNICNTIGSGSTIPGGGNLVGGLEYLAL